MKNGAVLTGAVAVLADFFARGFAVLALVVAVFFVAGAFFVAAAVFAVTIDAAGAAPWARGANGATAVHICLVAAAPTIAASTLEAPMPPSVEPAAPAH